MGGFALESSAFENAQAILSRHSCEGEDVSPPLAWSNVPEGTRSLALVVDDPDAPGGVFTHWIAWGLDPGADGLGEGEAAPGEGQNHLGTTATVARARRRGTGATATSFACTPSMQNPSSAPALRRLNSSRRSRGTC
jgi:Raf kinase inhibitor-like YbhB/YbcL family protein